MTKSYLWYEHFKEVFQRLIPEKKKETNKTRARINYATLIHFGKYMLINFVMLLPFSHFKHNENSHCFVLQCNEISCTLNFANDNAFAVTPDVCHTCKVKSLSLMAKWLT